MRASLQRLPSQPRNDGQMISAILVTHNSAACVGSCIDAIASALPGAETLVVDNASTDSSRAVAELHGARVISLDKNLGFGRACNIGARQAWHEHLLFLNPDVVIGSADARLLEDLLQTPDFGLNVPVSTRCQFMLTERSWIHETLSLSLRALRPRELPKHVPSPRAGRAPWVSGAALLVRKAEFLSVGGFDARYFLYYEDRDLSWKYRRHGLPLRATSALVADHAGGGSSELSDRRSNIAAYATIGWIQYRHAVCGRDAARRSWRLTRRTQAATARSVESIARIAPSSRLRRKSLQLKEVTQQLELICRSAGKLEQSDEHRYWPDAVAVLTDGSVGPNGA